MSVMNSPAVVGFVVIPSTVIWSYLVFWTVFALGLITMFVRGDWQKARGLDKLILFGPLFDAAPIAAFGTEHFTLTREIASIVPAFIPWHMFWTYFVGACFIAAALSLVTKIQARLAASLLALTFFLFVVLMDAPGWARNPQNRFALALMLRELAFCGGPLALAASLSGEGRGSRACDDRALLRRRSRAGLQHPAIHARRSRSRRSPRTAHSHVDLRTRHLDLRGGRGLRHWRHAVADRQEDPRRSHLGRLDRALRGDRRLRADRDRGTRQPRQGPELFRGYADVLRHSSTARGRHAARRVAGDAEFS